jgi:hypothetical protein
MTGVRLGGGHIFATNLIRLERRFVQQSRDGVKLNLSGLLGY